VNNLIKTKFCLPVCSVTFAVYLVPAVIGIKREVRCNSGAIPVAVSFFVRREASVVSYIMIYTSFPTLVETSNHCSG